MPETLCWNCKNTNRFKCSWFKDFTPVPGWVAEKTIRNYTHTSTWRDRGKIRRRSFAHEVESYYVIECPGFEPEPEREEAGKVYEPYSSVGSKGYYNAECCEKCYSRAVCEKSRGTCNRRARAQKVVKKPENPFKEGTKISKIYDGEWEDKTTAEIAEEIGMTKDNVRRSIYRIREKTGYDIPVKWDEEQRRRSRSRER